MSKVESAKADNTAQLPEKATEFHSDAEAWAAGKMWIPRAILLLYLVYADFRCLRDPMSSTMFSGITLAFHEMGHLLFAFAGHFIGSFMGSGMQVLVPIIVIILFLRQPDYFGVAVGGFWLSFSLFELANYVADDRAMRLPLVVFSVDPEHDWHHLLPTPPPRRPLCRLAPRTPSAARRPRSPPPGWPPRRPPPPSCAR